MLIGRGASIAVVSPVWRGDRRVAVAKKDKSKKAKKLFKKAKKMMKKAKKEMKKLRKKEKGLNTKVDRQDAPPTSPFSS
jgi:hypothetical protein